MAETLETPSAENMEFENPQAEDSSAENGAGSKRPRDDSSTVVAADETGNEEDQNGDAAKKLKTDESVEEQRLEKLKEKKNATAEGNSGSAIVGPKNFGSSVEMYDYFYKLLHCWSPNININKYEHGVLLELLKKGQSEPEKKIGDRVRAFQVRYHPQFKNRCFFLIREDESVDDFSFRKCVHHIIPLPENMQVKHDVNRALSGGGKGGGGRGGGRGRGCGRGRGGKLRN